MKAAPLGSRCVRVYLHILERLSATHTHTHVTMGAKRGWGLRLRSRCLHFPLPTLVRAREGASGEWRAEREIEIESRVTCSFGRTTLL